MESYGDALNELEKIVDELERGEVTVDVLTARVKRAMELIQACKTVLRETGKEVEELLKNMDEQGLK